MRVRALSIHADYACRHSGACCRSGWEIPVEPVAEARIREGIGRGLLGPAHDWARPLAGLPHAARIVLRVLASGDCVFLEDGEPRLCALHRALGPPAMPAACRHFPRVATLTPLGVSVSLSHYCPTAAALLFRDDVPLAVVADPPAFPAAYPWEGLDARAALPPMLRPGVLMSWEAHAHLEAHAVAVLGSEECGIDQALAALSAQAEVLRRWTPADGDFDAFVAGVLAARAGEPGQETPSRGLERALADWERVAGAVPAPHLRPPSPRPATRGPGLPLAERLVQAAASSGRRPVGRWLAAKAFGSWLALQGEGVRTAALGLRVAWSVLQAELARGGVDGEGAEAAPGAEGLKQAIRRADLLLVHLADPQALARELSRCERRS